jgi:excisionase family DNA binding protein
MRAMLAAIADAGLRSVNKLATRRPSTYVADLMAQAEHRGEDPIMTVREVSSYLQCHPASVYRLLRQSHIPAFKIGRDWRFRRSAIDEWLSGSTDNADSKPLSFQQG